MENIKLNRSQWLANRIADIREFIEDPELQEAFIGLAKLGVEPVMMPTPITPASTFDTAIPVVDDGDAVNRTTMVAQLQPLANRTEHLKDNKADKVAASSSDLQDASALSLDYKQPLVIADSSAFTWGGGGVPGAAGARLTQGAGPDSADYVRIMLTHLPQQGTLTAVKVKLKGGTSHSALPANKPVATIGRISATLGTFENYGAATDNAASAATYDAIHEFTVTPTAGIDLETYDVCLHLQGEYGTNSQDGLIVAGITAVVTPDKVTPG